MAAPQGHSHLNLGSRPVVDDPLFFDMNSEQHPPLAPVATGSYAASSSTDDLGDRLGSNNATGTQVTGAFHLTPGQSFSPWIQEHVSFDNTMPLDDRGELRQTVMHGEQDLYSAPFATNSWEAPLCTDAMGHHPGFNMAAGAQAMVAYDSMPAAYESLPAAYGSIPPVYMPVPPVFPGYFQQLPKEIQAQQIEIVLISLRQSGVPFAEISNTVKARFGVEMTVNSLVKRFGKLQDQYLGPLPEAVKNVMPDLVAAVKEKMALMDLSMLTEADKKAMQEILKELPKMIPRFVQSRVVRKRKDMNKSVL